MVDKMRRERKIGKIKRSQKSKLYFVQSWEMRKKKQLERARWAKMLRKEING